MKKNLKDNNMEILINKSSWENVNLCFLVDKVNVNVHHSFVTPYHFVSIVVVMYTICSHHYIAEILQRLA
jgi:hypothetical protein